MDIPEISLKSSSRFCLSVGIILFSLAGMIVYYFINSFYPKTSKSIFLAIYAILFFIFGGYFIIAGYIQLLKEEKFLKKYKQEMMVTEILQQDIKNAELKIKNIEYNTQAHNYNSNYGDVKFEIGKFRDMESMGRQILDEDFYKNV